MARDRQFESTFLQRGVSCEPDSQGPGFKRLVPPAGTIAHSCATDPTLHQVVRLGSGWHKPGIFNTDQGAQFTSDEFTKMLTDYGIEISMDGRGRCHDNIFVERLWWTVKHEWVYLRPAANGIEPRRRLGAFLDWDHLR